VIVKVKAALSPTFGRRKFCGPVLIDQPAGASMLSRPCELARAAVTVIITCLAVPGATR
jgi:hypothetical protein